MSDLSSPGPGPGADAGLLPATAEPLRVAARRLRWFRAALRRSLDQQGAAIGCTFDLDEGRLAQAFVAWLRAVEAQRPADPAQRRAFFEFAAGLMLRELVAAMPVRARENPTRAEPGSPAEFWPEGHACATFCVTVAAAALRQEFGEEAPGAAFGPEGSDLRHWWSFRENAAEDPGLAVAFLDLLTGHDPDWVTPGLFAARLRRGPALDPLAGSGRAGALIG